MSIGQGLTLITGPTGSGKTALVVSELAKLGDRPKCVMGIPDLKIDHDVCPPVEDWVELRPDPDDPSLMLPYFTFAPGSVVVLDEAQRVFRPRATGSKVPSTVAAFETRRHTGCDFVLLTQHPGLLDSNVRRLVNRHLHVHVTFLGSYLLEWVGVGDPESAGSRDLASRTSYKPPKESFALYKSSELHTKVVRRRPWQLFALAALLPICGFFGWRIYDSISGRMAGDKVAVVDSVAGGGPASPSRGSGSLGKAAEPAPKTAAMLLASYRPRIEGLQHTAPVYDELTKPVEAPVPSGCVSSKKRGCKCYDQRGNAYPTTEDICRQILERYLFVDFIKQESRKEGARRETAGNRGEDRRASDDRASGPVGPVAAAGETIAGNARVGPVNAFLP